MTPSKPFEDAVVLSFELLLLAADSHNKYLIEIVFANELGDKRKKKIFDVDETEIKVEGIMQKTQNVWRRIV